MRMTGRTGGWGRTWTTPTVEARPTTDGIDVLIGVDIDVLAVDGSGEHTEGNNVGDQVSHFERKLFL